MTDEEFLQLQEYPTESEEAVEEETLEQELEQQELPSEEPESSFEEEVPESTEPEQENSVEVDYKAGYEQLMAPFKANGKTVEIRDTEEAIQLMKMGANYTKKMQEIAPYRKIITMLQNHGLLDEGKLSYLIDLDKKNVGAIQKLVKDSEVDPLDLDVEAESSYTPANYSVSDNEVQFKEYLEELSSDPTGQSTIQVINQWDPESKAKLWEYPELMLVINNQRESGIYDQITSEIDRLRAFGKIPANMPFIEAYTRIGNELQKGNQINQRAPVATKVATPKSQVSNSQAARAASTPKGTKSPAMNMNQLVNLDDDAFMAQFEKFRNRV